MKKKVTLQAIMEQQNQYVKQFPELMKGKTVMYLHGFGSSGQSGTVTRCTRPARASYRGTGAAERTLRKGAAPPDSWHVDGWYVHRTTLRL